MSNSDYQNFFNSLELLLFVLDTDGTIINCNHTACARLGYTRGELIGMPVVNIHPSEQRMFAAMLVQDMIDGKEATCPIPVQTKTGELIQVETKVTRGSWQGKPALFGVTKDITALKLSNDKFSTIFQFAPVAIAITTIADGTIIDVNDAWLYLTGYWKDDVIGRRIYDLHLYQDNKDRDAIISQLRETHQAENIPVKMRTRQGKPIYGLFCGHPIMIDGTPCWITALNNQTSKVLLEQAIIDFKDKVAPTGLTRGWQ